MSKQKTKSQIKVHKIEMTVTVPRTERWCCIAWRWTKRIAGWLLYVVAILFLAFLIYGAGMSGIDHMKYQFHPKKLNCEPAAGTIQLGDYVKQNAEWDERMSELGMIFGRVEKVEDRQSPGHNLIRIEGQDIGVDEAWLQRLVCVEARS